MKIAIVGSGAMGSALGRLWARSGHTVTFSYSRSFDRLERLAREVGDGAKAATPARAVADADVVQLAVLWSTLDDALAQAGDLRGKVLIDNTAPIFYDDSTLVVGRTTSGAEVIAERSGARVVKAFNSIFADVLEAPSRDFGGQTPSLFYCGDDAQAKSVAAGLIAEAGFEPVDVGDLKKARLLEPFGLMIGHLGYAISPQISYQLMRR